MPEPTFGAKLTIDTAEAEAALKALGRSAEKLQKTVKGPTAAGPNPVVQQIKKDSAALNAAADEYKKAVSTITNGEPKAATGGSGRKPPRKPPAPPASAPPPPPPTPPTPPSGVGAIGAIQPTQSPHTAAVQAARLAAAQAAAAAAQIRVTKNQQAMQAAASRNAASVAAARGRAAASVAAANTRSAASGSASNAKAAASIAVAQARAAASVSNAQARAAASTAATTARSQASIANATANAAASQAASAARVTTAQNRAAAAQQILSAKTNAAMNKIKTQTSAQGALTGATNKFKSAATGASAALSQMNGGMGQLIHNSPEAAKKLQFVADAAQGVLLGSALLSGNIQQLGMNLVFLRFANIKMALAFTAVTVAILSTIKAAKGLSAVFAASVKAGNALEQTGQRLASFYRSADMAYKMLKQADVIDRAFGIGRDAALGMVDALSKVGLAQDLYIKAMGNIAAANGGDVVAISNQFADIMKATGERQGELSRQFQKDWNIPLKDYASAVDLATAANERFKSSLEAQAQTATGIKNRIQAEWKSTLANMGAVAIETVKPFLEVGLAFMKSLREGFKSAQDNSKRMQELNKALTGLKNNLRQVIPYAQMLGNALGKGLYYAILAVVKGLKWMTGALNAGLKWIKQYKDEITGAGQAFKTHFMDIILSSPVKFVAVSSALATFFLGLGSSIVKGFTTGGLKGGIGGLLSALFNPKLILTSVFAGLKSGLITAVLGALTLTVVDLLPVSEAMKKSIKSALSLGFLGAGIGSIFGPMGTLVGFAIGGAIGAGLEAIKPGLAGKVKTWIDNTINKVITGSLKFLKDDVLPVLQDFGNWFVDDGVPAVVDFSKAFWDDLEPALLRLWTWIDGPAKAIGIRFVNWIKTDAVNATKAWALETKTNLGPKLEALWDWMVDHGIPTTKDFTKAVGIDVVNASRGSADVTNKTLIPAFVSFSVLLNPINDLLGSLSTLLGVTLVGSLKFVQAPWDFFTMTFKDLHAFGKDHFFPLLKDLTIWFGLDFVDAFKKGNGGIAETIDKLTWLNDKVIIPLTSTTLKTLLSMWDDFWAKCSLLWIMLRDNLGPIIVTVTDSIDKLIKVLIAKDISPLDLIFLPVKTILDLIEESAGKAFTAIDKILGIKDKIGGGISKIPGSGAIGDILGMDVSGIVPGPIGKKQLIVAEGGERFMGHPAAANARANSGIISGGNSMYITLDLRGAVITDERGIRKIAELASNEIARTLRVNTRMSMHRVG